MLTRRFTRHSDMYSCRAGLLLAGLLVFAGSVHSAGPATAKEFATLIQQLGVDTSSDATTRSKLRAMLAKDKTPPATTENTDLLEGLWSGVVERVYVDHMDQQGNLVPGPTQYHLQTGTGHIQIYFMDEEVAHAASGKHMMIRGYLADKRVLVLEADNKERSLLKFGKTIQKNKH